MTTRAAPMSRVVELDAPAAPAQEHRAAAAAKQPRDPQTREERIETCHGLVRNLAWKIHQKVGGRVELDDLISYGEIGLAQAAADFDPVRGVKFVTYAYYRIRGAILDGLQKMSWFNRFDYHDSRYERLANDYLRVENEDAEAAEGSEHAGAQGDDARWVRDVSTGLAVACLVSGVDGATFDVADDHATEPWEQNAASELRLKLLQLISELPQEAATLVRCTYFEGQTIQEAGRRLGISRAWASRLHARALRRLAKGLRHAGIGDLETT